MSWILASIYCGAIWFVFAKLRLLRLTLPLAILLASVGPSLIVALLFCAQYFHPYTKAAITLEQIDPIGAQLTQPGRVTKVPVQANVPVKLGETLFEVDKIPYELAIQRLESSLNQVKQQVEVAVSSVSLAEANQRRAEADLQYAESERDRNQKLLVANATSKQEFELSQTRYEQAKAAFEQSQEKLKQAQLSVGVANSEVQQVESSLRDARYDLKQTTIVAPADGYVTNLQVRPGLLVSASTGPVITFVRQKAASYQGVVVATFPQKNYLRIKPGQYTEVVMDGYPGRILTGRVLNTIDVSGAGQIDAGGRLPTSVISEAPTQFAVRIQLDDRELRLPGGARGQAAVYTEDLQLAGIPVMFVMRANSWLNYIF